MRAITVEPVGREGWAVKVEGVAEPSVFRSGASAERSARSLARRLAAAGEPSEIAIFLRDGALGGRFVVGG